LKSLAVATLALDDIGSAFCAIPELGGKAYYENRATFQRADDNPQCHPPIHRGIPLNKPLTLARKTRCSTPPPIRDPLKRVIYKLRTARLLCLKAA